MPPIFSTYILTNYNKTVLYVGVTNNLATRLIEHWMGKPGSFTSKYETYYLIWFEHSKYIRNAIEQEKTIKQYTRLQKEALIYSFNPQWRFLNEEMLGNWPPTDEQKKQHKRVGKINNKREPTPKIVYWAQIPFGNDKSRCRKKL